MTDEAPIPPVPSVLGSSIVDFRASKSESLLPLSDKAIRAPRLEAGNVPRRDLLDSLFDIEPQLLILQAGAGMGKTVLLSQYCWEQRTRSRRSVAWLSLSENEESPERFLGALSLSLRRACPEVGERLQMLLLSSADIPSDLAMMLLCNELSQYDKPISLVLDNCETVRSDIIWRLIKMLLDNSGCSLQLLCASQVHVPLVDSRDLLEGKQVIFSTKSLRYTPSEAKEFMLQNYLWEPSESVMHACYKYSVGWPLLLTAVKQQFKTPVEFTEQNFDDLMEPYFRDYSQKYNEHDLEIILCGSILNTPSINMVSKILDVPEEDVAIIFHREFPVVKMEGDVVILHPLFKRYIHVEMLFESPSKLDEFHRKAAQIYGDCGETREAVYHCLFTDDGENILSYLEEVMMDMMLKSELETLNDWVSQLRSLDIKLSQHQEGVLELIELWTKAFLFQHAEVSERLEVMQSRLANDEIFLTDTAYVTLLTIKILNFAYNERFEEAAELALEVLDSKIEVSHWVKGILQNIMCYYSILKLEFSRAEFYQEQLSTHLDDKNVFVRTYSEVLYGHYMVKCARWPEAKGYLYKGLEVSESDGNSHSIAVGVAVGFLSEYYYETYQFDAVEKEVWFRLDTIDAGALIDASYRAYLSLARVLAVRLEYERAHELLDRGISHAKERGWDRMLAACLCEHIKFYMLENRRKKATECLNNLWSIDERNHKSEPIVKDEVRYFLLIAQALSNLSECPSENLEKDIVARIDLLESHGAHLYAQRLKVALVIHYFQQSNRLAANAILTPVIEFCLENGSPSVLLDSGDIIFKAVSNLVDQTKELKSVGEIWRSLSNSSVRCKAEAVTRNEVSNTDIDIPQMLSEKELEVITLLSSGLSNKDISGLLGISVGTVKWHLSNLYRKMSVSSRTEAVFEAKIMGLIT